MLVGISSNVMNSPRRLFVLACVLFATAHASDALVVVLKDADGSPVVDAVVQVKAIGDGGTDELRPVRAEIEQRDQEFQPRIAVVPVGSTVVFPNRDDVKHHVYSLSKVRRFEIPLSGPEDTGEIVFDRAGVIAVGCNIHDWMVAYVVVVDTPAWAWSDAGGTARIERSPAGPARIEIWHERLARVSIHDVSAEALASGRPLEFVLKLRPERAGDHDAGGVRRRRY